MGYTTSISDYEMGRAWTHVPAPDGVDIEAEREKSEKPVTKSKVVTSKEKKPPVTTTAETKSK